MIKFAIFDLDGTILDSSQMWMTLGERYLAALGKTPAEDLSERLNAMTIPESAAFLRGEYGIPYSPEEIVRQINRMTEQFYLEQVGLKEGALRLLSALRSHCVRMSVATAGDANLGTTALTRLGVSDFFAGLASCSDYGAKTSPEVYFAAADLIYALPKETMVFEDSLYAVRTAKKAGFATAAAADIGEKNQEELRRTADFYAASLKIHAENVSELLAFGG